MASTQSSSSQGQQVPTRAQQIPKVKTKFAGKIESLAHLSMRKKHEERNALVVDRGAIPPVDATPPAPPVAEAGGVKETVLVLPSGGTVRLRPRTEGDGNESGGSRMRPARGSEKREASEEPQSDYPQEEKSQKIDGIEEDHDVALMEALEEAEDDPSPTFIGVPSPDNHMRRSSGSFVYEFELCR